MKPTSLKNTAPADPTATRTTPMDPISLAADNDPAPSSPAPSSPNSPTSTPLPKPSTSTHTAEKPDSRSNAKAASSAPTATSLDPEQSPSVPQPAVPARSKQGDEDVREIPVQTVNRDSDLRDFPPFSITDYKFVNCIARLEDFCTLSHCSREINEQHVSSLKSIFSDKGFNPVVGTFVVVQLPDIHDINENPGDDGVIGQCALVDGRHRFSAICALYASDSDKWYHIWHRAPVAKVERKDGEVISILEILALSSYFNELSSAVLKVSFMDYVHAAIQTTKVLATSKRTYVADLSIGEIANGLLDRRTLGNIDERQLRRYASVARKLAQRDEYYQSIKSFCGSCEGVGLVHLNSQVLFSFSNIDLWQLAIASMCALVVNGVKGSFESFHVRFYDCVRQMFDVVQKTASHRQMSLKTLMDSELYITAHISKTVFQYIANTMSRYTLVENQDSADKTRVRNLKKKLIQLLGGDIEPAEFADPIKPNASKSRAKSTASSPDKDAVNREVVSEDERLRRGTRKRKAVVQESNDELNQGDAPRPVKKPRRKASARGSASVRGANSGEQQTSALTVNTVSSFLRALSAAELTSLIGSLGINVAASSRSSRSRIRRRDAESGAWDVTEPLEVLPSFYDSFDDDLPGTIPDVWADPSPYTGPSQPSWLKYITMIPSKWPTAIPIEHVTPWLDAMHVPHEHRAHSVINNVHILRQTHHSVFFHAAHSFHKHRTVSELPEFPPVFQDPVTTNEKLWASAVLEDEAALEFFGGKKERISTEGFCVLEGFLNDKRIPDRVGNYTFHKVNCTHPFFKSLENEARASFPGEEALRNPSARTTWKIMENVSPSVDSSAVDQGQGRFRMTNHGILERLEKDSDTMWTISGRALVDLRVAQCVAALKLTSKIGSKRLFMPRTGGRWIMTSTQCQRQVLHTDFKPLSRHDTLSDNKSPGYFTIATGEREVPLWVCSHSHRLAATNSAAKSRAAASGASAHLIRVPPFSIFVGRGDLYYAGPASSDSVGNERLLYYHNLFVLDGEDIPRLVRVNPNFRPRFTATLDEDSDDEATQGTESAPNNVGSVKKARVVDSSDEEYHSDEIGGADDDDEDDDDVEFSNFA